MNKELQNNWYVVVKNFIPKERAYYLARELHHFVIERGLQGDTQVEKSACVHNFLYFLELLCEKTPEVSELAGTIVLPTYTYGRIYFPEAELLPHTDRDSCEISLSVNLYGGAQWPFLIQKADQTIVSVDLNVGDAILYLGCIAAHARDKWLPPASDYYAQVFLHYVQSRGHRGRSYFDSYRPEVEANLLRQGLI